MRLTVAAAIFFTLKNRLSFTALFVDDVAAKKGQAANRKPALQD
jgi:hypothetical protein